MAENWADLSVALAHMSALLLVFRSAGQMVAKWENEEWEQLWGEGWD